MNISINMPLTLSRQIAGFIRTINYCSGSSHIWKKVITMLQSVQNESFKRTTKKLDFLCHSLPKGCKSSHRTSTQMDHDKYSLRVQLFGNLSKTIIVTVKVITPVGGNPACRHPAFSSWAHQQPKRIGLLYLPSVSISPNTGRPSRLFFCPFVGPRAYNRSRAIVNTLLLILFAGIWNKL